MSKKQPFEIDKKGKIHFERKIVDNGNYKMLITVPAKAFRQHAGKRAKVIIEVLEDE